MKTTVRSLTLAVAAVFGATAIALSVGPLDDRIAGIGVIASAYAKEEGGSSGGHTSGTTAGSSGGHTSGATSQSSSSGGHTSGGGSDKGGSSAGGHTSGGGSDKGGASGGHTSGGGSDKGGASGGHTSGGGSDKGGSSGGHTTGADSGHASGGGSKGGGPNTASHRYGLERADHGTKPGHEGHASGVHGANAKHGASSHSSGSDRRFGGGSGIGGMEQVLEGPARFAETSTLTQTASTDPGPKFRFRYWGGWAIPEPPGVDDGTDVAVNPVDIGDTSSTAAPVGGGGGPLAKLVLNSPARCDDVGQNMPTRAFYTTANLSRLDAALVELDPDAVRAGRGLDPTMMANVQEELVDGRADPVLIGSYLGMMSRKPLSAETVKRVAYRLCAPIDDNTASQIARMAEEVRSVASAD
jgi:hypothetical protein